MNKTGGELQHANLDAGMSMDNFRSIIADQYNDSSVTVQFNLAGTMDDVDGIDLAFRVR